MSAMTDVYDSTRSWAEQRQLALGCEREMTSTNDLAKSEAMNEASEFKLYLAAHQTKGRGRGKNTWSDTGAGDGLLSSWSFQMKGAPQPITGPCLGLALFSAAQRVWSEREWSIKAPNDLYLDGKKIAGILAETISAGNKIRLIVGIGMNVLNHPRALENSIHLESDVDSADWFLFLDELYAQLKQASLSAQNHQLTKPQQSELLNALNANANKAFIATEITPTGDIVHSKGRVRWTDL